MERGVAEISIVGANDEPAIDAFRVLLSAYETSLPEDLRIADLDGELRDLAKRYADGALLLARIAAQPIGCAIVNHIDRESAEIKRLFVVPEARGTGTGRALMQAAIAYARNRKYARIVLDTERTRLAQAYALYLSLGFVHCEPYAPVTYLNPTYMELPL